jgi:hypothetical protein
MEPWTPVLDIYHVNTGKEDVTLLINLEVSLLLYHQRGCATMVAASKRERPHTCV